MQRKGVDISEMNGSVDFASLKQAGVEFVIIRCGYGNDILHQDDARFAENVRKADSAKMPWGTYLYSYATNSDMARSEARHVLRLLNGGKPAYGVWYDVEDSQQAGADLVSICEAFCGMVEAAGLYVGIYSMLSWMNGKLGSSRLDKYDKWVAQWNSVCDYKKPFGIWQYTDHLTISGKAFDGNYAYKDYPTLTGAVKKEEAELTEAQVRAMVREEYSRQNPTYNTLEEIPTYWREAVRDLMEKGIINGTGNGKLGLTKSECKAAVMVMRSLVHAREKEA